MTKLNLGCGKDYREGYINLDISADVGADIVEDITRCNPFRENTFDEVIVNNVLTQILDPKDFVMVMNTLWYITKGSGCIFIRVPNAKHVCAFQDPMDCRRFTDQTFTYMEFGHRRYEQYGKHYGFKPFQVELLSNNKRQMEFKLCPKK
jgi:hypothetical protein